METVPKWKQSEMGECGPVECDKYAFLLGSALRNSDQDNFFTVYDSILPPKISGSQLHWIKERARYIADLPEEEFNDWVLNARSYSLAPGIDSMSKSRTTRAIVSVRDCLSDDDDDDTTRSYPSSSATRMYKSGSQTDKDSGKPATTSRKNSFESFELSEEARGVYDYYPQYSESVKIQDLTGTCPEYDEAIDVESDKSSIESPRSEDSGKGEYNVTQPDEYGIEMKTYNNHHAPGYHASDEDSDDVCQPHKRLYRNPSQYGYKRLDEESDDYQMPTCVEQSSRIPEITFRGFQAKDRLATAVDSGTNFSLKPTSASLGALASKAEYQWKHKTKNSKAIGRMMELALPSTTNSATSQVCPATQFGFEENDSLSRGQFTGFDENGNPVEKSYSQMRERPVSREDSTINSSVFPRYGTTNEYPIGSLEPSSYNTENKAKIGNKKSKQKREEPVLLAENVENYQGDKDLEELVKFIEQNETKENSVKKSNGTPNVKVDKTVKKTKDKKTKTFPIVPSVPKPGDHIVIEIEVDSKSDVMGNSSEKLPDNDEIVGRNDKHDLSKIESEKLQKSKGSDSDGKTKNKNTKDETISEKRSKNNVKKEVKDSKFNGYNHTVESAEGVIVKENDKKTKDNNKKVGNVNKTSESVNEKKKVHTKIQVDTNIDKKLSNSSKSPGEIKTPLPTSPLSVKTDDYMSELNNYIFTDIPVAHIEPEFTIVNKKKKKPLPVAHVIPSRDQFFSREFPVTRSKYRDGYSQSVPRSVTPPPSKSRDKNQDFSLTAFPALGNNLVTKDKVNPLETRRSSIGDLPLVGESSSLDDSDIASVKSLPAAQAGKLVDVVSLRLQKSYAIIAATSRQVGYNISPDTSYEDYNGESPDKPKQTVWKGSLTERRHSIGSSPDDGKLENPTGLSESSRQKSGSQEMLKKENSSPKANEPANNSVSGSACRQGTCVNNMPECEQPNDGSSNLSNNVERTQVNCSLEFTHASTASVSPSKEEIPIKPFDLSHFDTVPPGSSASVLAHATANSPVTFMEKSVVMSPVCEQTESVIPAKSKSLILVNSSDIRSQNVTAVSSPNIKSLTKTKTLSKVPVNGRKNKSVVFLDKRDAPSNLDITFGFDETAFEESNNVLCSAINKENASTTTYERGICKMNDARDPVIPTAVVSVNQINKEKKDVNIVKPLNHVVNPSDLQPGHVFTQTLLETDKQGGQIVPNYTTAKSLTDHVNHLNGVVKNVGQRISNKQQTLPSEITSEICSSVNPIQTSDTAECNVPSSVVSQSVAKDIDMCSLDNTSVIVDETKTVIIYGDALGNQDGRVSNGGDNNLKTIQFILSKNINCGKFNHHEAVNQLKKEWDRVMELKSRNPDSVQVYSSQ